MNALEISLSKTFVQSFKCFRETCVFFWNDVIKYVLALLTRHVFSAPDCAVTVSAVRAYTYAQTFSQHALHNFVQKVSATLLLRANCYRMLTVTHPFVMPNFLFGQVLYDGMISKALLKVCIGTSMTTCAVYLQNGTRVPLSSIDFELMT